MVKGLYEIDVPNTFNGIGKSIPKNSSKTSLTFSAKYVDYDKINMNGAKNDELRSKDFDPIVADDYQIMGETSIKDMKYKPKPFPIAGAFTYVHKAESILYGFSFGMDPSLYFNFIIGSNYDTYEWGIVADISLYGRSDVSFNYYECTKFNRDEGCVEKSDIEHFEKENVYSNRFGIGFYASKFWDKFALTYAPSAMKPLISDDYTLPSEYGGKDIFRTRVLHPWILNQYVGGSYWLDEHWKTSLGTTIQSGFTFQSIAWTVNWSLGYWF